MVRNSPPTFRFMLGRPWEVVVAHIGTAGLAIAFCGLASDSVPMLLLGAFTFGPIAGALMVDLVLEVYHILETYEEIDPTEL